MPPASATQNRREGRWDPLRLFFFKLWLQAHHIQCVFLNIQFRGFENKLHHHPLPEHFPHAPTGNSVPIKHHPPGAPPPGPGNLHPTFCPYE